MSENSSHSNPPTGAPTGSTLTFPKRSGDLTPEMRELELQSFGIAFESVLETLAEGRSLDEFCRSYHTQLSPARFRTWIYRDRNRRNAYLAAKAVGAEAVEDELIRIADGTLADGSASPDDVTRSQLRINTRKWLLQVWNRKRYGDVKTVESHSTTRFDVSSTSSAELQRRVLESLGLDGAIASEEFAGEAAGGEADDLLSGLFGGGEHER